MAVIVFCGVAGKVLLADYKRLLVNGLNLGQPSFIYAYLALLVQSGKLTIICLTSFELNVIFFYRFLTTDWLSWCLKTIRKITKCILVTATCIIIRRCNFRHFLDV